MVKFKLVIFCHFFLNRGIGLVCLPKHLKCRELIGRTVIIGIRIGDKKNLKL